MIMVDVNIIAPTLKVVSTVLVKKVTGWLMMISIVKVQARKELHFHIIRLDIDECKENSHLCDHNCYNTNGSYICDCQPGYTMNDTIYSCIGINNL